ncbi:hypothetical protein APHCRT_1343 [Anaplasma phagocytophilum str. CRT53-1]|uniref:Uncharacterized protein n=1 Tax=Anaplasma phagocytophilum str. CRT53-1 TaxID=1359157 RepID=A0A0F3PQG1_ANAPH|nr:hypothetical protein APHCRT_1343 [Anaplasma phagocytophilum str. CRT53-1]
MSAIHTEQARYTASVPLIERGLLPFKIHNTPALDAIANAPANPTQSVLPVKKLTVIGMSRNAAINAVNIPVMKATEPTHKPLFLTFIPLHR